MIWYNESWFQITSPWFNLISYDLPVWLLEKFTYSNNEFFVYHIDTQVITQQKCIQNRRFSKHISYMYVAAWTSFNQDLLYQIINLWFKIRVYYIKSWTNDLKSGFIISNHDLKSRFILSNHKCMIWNKNLLYQWRMIISQKNYLVDNKKNTKLSYTYM